MMSLGATLDYIIASSAYQISGSSERPVPTEKAKKHTNANPSAGGIYAPQMKDSCKDKSPVVHRQNGGQLDEVEVGYMRVRRGALLNSKCSPYSMSVRQSRN